MFTGIIIAWIFTTIGIQSLYWYLFGFKRFDIKDLMMLRNRFGIIDDNSFLIYFLFVITIMPLNKVYDMVS
jgi:hypothetical protein